MLKQSLTRSALSPDSKRIELRSSGPVAKGNGGSFENRRRADGGGNTVMLCFGLRAGRATLAANPHACVRVVGKLRRIASVDVFPVDLGPRMRAMVVALDLHFYAQFPGY